MRHESPATRRQGRRLVAFMLLTGVAICALLVQPARPAHQRRLPATASLQWSSTDWATQGIAQGTCAGHSAANAVQAIRYKSAGIDETLSGEWVQLRGYDALGLTSGGLRPNHVATVVYDDGICTEMLCPNRWYFRWLFTGSYPSGAAADADTRRVESWRFVDDVDDVVRSLAPGSPRAVVIGFKLPLTVGSFDALTHVEVYNPGTRWAAHAGALVDLADGAVVYVDPRNIPQRVKTLSLPAADAMMHSLDEYSATAPQRVLLEGIVE